jgi:serine/threonine protein kinase/Tfp pilus assembly protein PilF
MIGQTLDHYRIIEKIGEGGMGVVYRARDERLDRDVALKVLPESMLKDAAALKSFRKEAHALSRLSHPNIATVHDFGTQDAVTFLVMEYIPGVTLDQKLAAGPLPEKDVLRLGAQLTQGLAAAHKVQLIHRDLKPSNLRITPDGRLKILDFGLAKLIRPEQLDATQSITEPHQVAGTVPYMSPEQLQGEPADERSDIYSAGAVLYEMITDRRPFPETYAPLLIDSILHKQPQPPSSINHKMSPELESVILKALDKDPDHRYQSAKELEVDLERIGSAHFHPTVPHKSRRRQLTVAVTLLVFLISIGLVVNALAPFVSNYFFPPHHVPGIPSPDDGKYLAVLIDSRKDLQPIADQLTRGISVKLMRIRELSVASPRGTQRALQEPTAATPQEVSCGPVQRRLDKIACQLFVNLVLHGSLKENAKGKISIDVNLVDIANGRTKWIGSFDGRDSELYKLEDQIHEAIVRKLNFSSSSADRLQLSAQSADVPEATKLYNDGQTALQRDSDVTSLNTAIECFEAATKSNPNLARAYVGLAQAKWKMWKITRKQDFLTEATSAAIQARNQNENLSYKEHVSLAYVFLDAQDTENAKTQLFSAMEINPNDAEVWRELGSTSLEEGANKARVLFYYINATHIVPDYHWNWNELGVAYHHFGDWKNAAEAFKRTIELNDKDPSGYVNLGEALCKQGEYDNCLAEYKKALDRQEAGGFPPDAYIYLSLGEAYLARGQYTQALTAGKMALQIEPDNYLMSQGLADAYEANGETDKANELYKKATDLANQALEANSKDYSALGDLARFFAKANDPLHAKESIQRARHHDPHDVELMYREAEVYSLLHEENEAFESLNRAFEYGFTPSAAEIDRDLGSLRSSRAADFERLVNDFSAKSK